MTVKQYQTDPIKRYARKVATVESGNNPNAKNPYSSAGGLHQFLESSFTGISDKYNLGYTAEDRFDPKKSERAFELFTKDNEKVLKKTLGDNITDGDRYLAHFLGAGGANRFFQAYKQNPNADASSVFSPQVIAANKNVLAGKKLQDVYQWANNKMDVEVDNITQDFTNYEVPNNNINFTESPVDLQALPEQPVEVAEAKQSLKQQNNEFNFLKDLQSFQSKPPQQVEEVAQTQLKSPDVLGIYQQVSSFIENPLMQKGGTIYVDSKNDPRYRAYQDSLSLYRIAPERGSIIEKPTRRYSQEDFDSHYKMWHDDTYRDSNLKNVNLPKGAADRVQPISVSGDTGYPSYKKPNQRVVYDPTPQVDSIGQLQPPQVIIESNITATQLPNYPNSQFKTYGIDRFQNRYLATGQTPPAPGRNSRPKDWNQDVEMVWLRDPQELGINRQQKYGYNLYDESYKNAQEGVDFIYIPVNRMQQGGVVEDNMGQWKYPGQITKINSGNITMKNVNYPVLGIDNLGNRQLMFPNNDYKFKGTSVTEYPLANLQNYFSK